MTLARLRAAWAALWADPPTAHPIAQAVWQALRTAENTGALVLPA